MIEYVLGFGFTPDGSVALIQKKRPHWQKDRWNGIGGHRQSNELSRVAMSREFLEEAGVEITPDLWRFIGRMGNQNWNCRVFTVTHESVRHVKTTTDERVMLIDPDRHLHLLPTLENIPALIAMCRIKPDHTGVMPLVSFEYVQ